MAIIQKSFVELGLDELLAEWDSPLAVKDLDQAEELVHRLRLEVAGLESIINVMKMDIEYYRKDHGI